MIFDNVKRLCAERGIKISDIEAGTCVGKNTIYGWQTRMPSANNLKSVADYFGVTVDELMKEDA